MRRKPSEPATEDAPSRPSSSVKTPSSSVQTSSSSVTKSSEHGLRIKTRGDRYAARNKKRRLDGPNIRAFLKTYFEAVMTGGASGSDELDPTLRKLLVKFEVISEADSILPENHAAILEAVLDAMDESDVEADLVSPTSDIDMTPSPTRSPSPEPSTLR